MLTGTVWFSMIHTMGSTCPQAGVRLFQAVRVNTLCSSTSHSILNLNRHFTSLALKCFTPPHPLFLAHLAVKGYFLTTDFLAEECLIRSFPPCQGFLLDLTVCSTCFYCSFAAPKENPSNTKHSIRR